MRSRPSNARFSFGENWLDFLAHVDERRICEAERSLCELLGVATLEGLTVLDIGCGSGLFSLAALRLGARSVQSFDYDAESVACVTVLRDRFGHAERWTIEHGNVLDAGYVGSLGCFDLVYAWGSLHHTGDMSRAMENAGRAVAAGGRLFVSVYNDQGRRSRRWRRIKHLYNRLPEGLRVPYTCLVIAPGEALALLRVTVRGRPGDYISGWIDYRRNRGMTRWHDIVDWVGGYPFDVARPEEVFDFYHDRGFVLARIATCGGGPGCNQFVFERPARDDQCRLAVVAEVTASGT